MSKIKNLSLTIMSVAALGATSVVANYQPNNTSNEVQASTRLSRSERSAKAWIARHESGGNWRARNGRCYGKYQLDITYLHGNLSHKHQSKTADRYVHSRYGSWKNAKRHWLSAHWY